MSDERTTLEEDTRNFFGKWHKWFLRRSLSKFIKRADKLLDKTWGRSSCGCYVDEAMSSLCFWHALDAYLR